MNSMYPDLYIVQKYVYEPSGLTIKNLIESPESRDYGACNFEIKNQRVAFRIGKITPKKTGQFITLWKRIGTGPIIPYDMADPVDLFVVSVRNAEHFGQFVFPKSVLYEKGVISKEGKGGQRAMRIYPLWDLPNNQYAKKTQEWQCKYFFNIDSCIDNKLIIKLFS